MKKVNHFHLFTITRMCFLASAILAKFSTSFMYSKINLFADNIKINPKLIFEPHDTFFSCYDFFLISIYLTSQIYIIFHYLCRAVNLNYCQNKYFEICIDSTM